MNLSVVIPTIGRERYLDISIGSLINQTAFEEIVVFDNSPTQQLRTTSKWKADPRIRWEQSGKMLPAIESWNMAVSKCRTRWVTIFGDDDVAEENFGAELLKLTAQPALIHATFHLIDENGIRSQQETVIPESCLAQDFRHARMRGEIYCVIPGFAFLLEDFKAVGGFRSLGLPSDLYCDDDLWFRISAKAGMVNVLALKTWSYRRHLQQIARKFDLYKFIYNFNAYAETMQRALEALGVPSDEVYPPDMGLRGYKKRILQERFRLWLNNEDAKLASTIKYVLGMPVGFLTKLYWIAHATRKALL